MNLKSIGFSKIYNNVRFKAEILREIIQLWEGGLKSGKIEYENEVMSVAEMGGEWTYPNREEYLFCYPHGIRAYYCKTINIKDSCENRLKIHTFADATGIEVTADNRSHVAAVVNFIESKVIESTRAKPPEPATPILPSVVVFIGHGRNTVWRDLKDHLQEKQGLSVEAYEVGSRAGHAIRDILEGMLERSTIAFLVMTGEDATADGAMRARQNVIHEIGLFQGRLGFQRAIVLLEKGTEEFSNLAGIEYHSFSKGNIREAFGDVLATIRREFPNALGHKE